MSILQKKDKAEEPEKNFAKVACLVADPWFETQTAWQSHCSKYTSLAVHIIYSTAVMFPFAQDLRYVIRYKEVNSIQRYDPIFHTIIIILLSILSTESPLALLYSYISCKEYNKHAGIRNSIFLKFHCICFLLELVIIAT